jgi:hypothetical protein
VSLEDLLIGPDRLIHVTHDLPDGSSTTVVAIACAYTAVQQNGRNAVAIEVIYDPETQPPIELPREAYPCPLARLQRRLLRPKDVKRIAVAIIDEPQLTKLEEADE